MRTNIQCVKKLVRALKNLKGGHKPEIFAKGAMCD